jgi:hypothetical protein
MALESDMQLTGRFEEEAAPVGAEDQPLGLGVPGAENAPRGVGARHPFDDATLMQKLLTRRTLSMVLVGVDVAVLVMVFAHVHGPARLVLGLVLGAFIPGWSIVGLLGLGHMALEVSLAVAMSFVLLMLSAQVLMTVHQWHLQGFEEVVCVLCLPSLVWQSRRRKS